MIEPTDDAQKEAIAAAEGVAPASSHWLNPPEWTRTEILEFPGSADGPWKRYIEGPAGPNCIGTVRYPRLIPKDEDCAKELKKCTLTNLYNQRPTWLALAHHRLDEAVFTAYGWDSTMTDGTSSSLQHRLPIQVSAKDCCENGIVRRPQRSSIGCFGD